MVTTIDQPIHSGALELRHPGDDVSRMYIGFVNVYFVGLRGGPWVLVDTGLRHAAKLIRGRARDLFGSMAPEAIVLTHGHFDHAGNALELARAWDVRVYAHPLELPFLSGRSAYPPHDPTVGGALGLMSRAFPHEGTDLGDRVHPLPEDGTLPGMPGWRWMHTPGHTAGHVSLFRDFDKFLIAGDALATVDQDSPLAMFNLKDQFSVPPAPLTTDWAAARTSVERLAALSPHTIAAGHGRPVQGDHVAEDLRRFALHFTPPARGRYVREPAVTDGNGVVSVPPAVHDPLPKQLAIGAVVAGAAWLLTRARRRD